MPGVSPGRGVETSLLILLLLLLLQGGQPAVTQSSTTQSPTTHVPVDAPRNGSTTGPAGVNWMECHGFPEGTCRQMKKRVTQLETMLTQRAQRGNNGKLYAKQVAQSPPGNHSDTQEEDQEEEQVFLTPEQIEYFISTLDNRRRYRRKVDSFSQFVSKWPLPIKYAFDGSHTTADREKIREAISHWESQTCVRFKEVDANFVDPSDQNKILFMKFRGCGSYIGKVNISPQPVDLASRCLKHFGIIAHEIGHVIGFWHEHQRSDRDSYIQIKSNNAVVGLSFVSELMRLGRTSNLLPYDYGSVLHYSAKTMSVNGDYTIETKNPLYQKTIGQRTGLSFLDAKLANLVYCTESCFTPLPHACQNDGYQDPNNCNACRCPDGLAGTYCDRVAPSVNAACGGHILVYDVPQYITSPNYYQGYYDDHVECTWLIQAQVGYTIQLRFESDFGIYCVDGVCFHWVEVRYEDNVSNVGPRFCCTALPQVTLQSSRNQMMILFRSNYTTHSGDRRGFRATFWAVPSKTQTAPTQLPNNWYTNGPNLARVVTPITDQTTPIPNTPLPTGTRKGTPPPTQRVVPTWPTVRPGQECSPLDVAVILDSSGSVGASNWPKMLEFAVSLARRFTIGYDDVRLGAVSFGTTAELHFPLLSYTSEQGISAALRNIRWKDQMTNTSGGIWLTRTSLFTPSGGDRPWAPNIAILLTDGEANRDTDRTIPEAIITKQAGNVLKVVGIGNRLKRLELEAVASQPLKDNLYFANTFDDLPRLEQSLVASMCALTGRASSRPPSSTTVHPFSTRGPQGSSTKGPTLGPTLGSTVWLTPGPNPDCRHPGPADIAFVVDSSGSIGPVNWRKVLDFLRAFVSQLSIGLYEHRVGVVTYGTYGQFIFGLDTYSDLDRLRYALDQLRWLDEMTNTSGGIYVMRNLLFDSRSGDRPNVPNIAIVLTDGESNRDPDRVRPEAEAARNAGISMFVIGVGDKLNMVELESIANHPTDQYLYRTRDFNDLQYVIVNIIKVICDITNTGTGGTMRQTQRTSSQPPTRTAQTTRPIQPSSPITPGPTQTPYPTFTPYPTPTPYPTRSPYPTRTPYPTQRTPNTGYTPYPTRPSVPTPGLSTYTSPVDCSTSRADIIFVLDSSGSVGRTNWPLMMNFTKAVMRKMTYARNQYGIVTFGNEATLDVSLGQYASQVDVFAAVDRIRWKDEWTNTSGGLWMMREELTRLSAGVQRIGVLVTDGESNRDRQRTLPEARAVHTAGITMFAIGVGPNIDLPELQAISSDPRTTYLRRSDDFRRLWTLAAGVANTICAISGGGRPSPTPDTPMMSPITRMSGGPPSPVPTGGYYSGCYPLDLAFAIDASRTVGGINDWSMVLRFVADMVRSLPVSSDKVKVGVITYSDKAQVDIPLGTYPDVNQLANTIRHLSWRNQRTNTSGGILLMRSNVLMTSDPARFRVPKVGVVITAGRSNMDSHLTLPEANVAKQQGIDMFAIGVTSQVSDSEVAGIASQPSATHALYTENFDKLYLLRDTLLRSMCARYAVGTRSISSTTRTTKEPTTTTSNQDSWGAWTACSRPCGGCGRRWRSKQCTDTSGRTQDCGLPEEEKCNAQPCTSSDVCKFYVAWRQYNRPCQPCCYGFEPDYNQNVCIPT